MKIIENGNFTPWVRDLFSLAGLLMFALGMVFLNIWTFYLVILPALVLTWIGAYSEKANRHGIKPFGTGYEKARRSYTGVDEGPQEKIGAIKRLEKYIHRKMQEDGQIDIFELKKESGNPKSTRQGGAKNDIH